MDAVASGAIVKITKTNKEEYIMNLPMIEVVELEVEEIELFDVQS